MISCLILYFPNIPYLSLSKILKVMFFDQLYEIDVLDDDIIIIYLWNVNKIPTWQAVVTLESTNIMAGFGFGSSKKQAHHQAWEVLLTRVKEI